ncbi:hypothetical protein QJS10_CPB13g00585 [Acorus calamus]|uniref:Uncharacterized protein n=1 Tax=Acorus calamus TaxID=4465 RepID=A0AAV9DIQ9_ACOCL|nr:hypothetical protein QJS10_CPB13g00585 [Acorus calamus]
MPSSDNGGEDIFFDSLDCVGSDFLGSQLSVDPVFEDSEPGLDESEHEIWTSEPKSVRERRERFLHGLGLSKQVAPDPGSEMVPKDESVELVELLTLQRIRDSGDAVSGSDDSFHCIRDLDSGNKFIIYDLGQDGFLNALKEVGSDKLFTMREFEMYLGLSSSVQWLMRREGASCREKGDSVKVVNKKTWKNWWRRFRVKNRVGGLCRCDENAVFHPQQHVTMRTKVHRYRKRCMELSSVIMGQEIQAHKGFICVMKFSPDGKYLATGGEDCVVRVWRVIEADASRKCIPTEESSRYNGKAKDGNFVMQNVYFAPVVIPKKVFMIDNIPLHEFRGHCSDILDLSWSSSGLLLSSSKDSTARLWKVGLEECIQVYHHNNYVTCIQFNPVDDKYFISGSIDGKVRVWGIPGKRVVDWVDVRDIVTAVCYRPDGKGFVIGTITGDCRFYNLSGHALQLDTQFCIQGKKKSSGKRITGFQFCPEDPKKVMITSADSKVRVYHNADVVHRYQGLRKAGNLTSASFTSDGRYIVSVGEDSRVYFWNHGVSDNPSSKTAKSTHSCEHFLSEGASIAVPWPGINQTTPRMPVVQPRHPKERPSLSQDLDLFFLSGVIWPKGKLSLWDFQVTDRSIEHTPHQKKPQNKCQQQYHRVHCVTPPSTAWNLVVVTASSDGVIRSFHNYGLPVRL